MSQTEECSPTDTATNLFVIDTLTGRLLVEGQGEAQGELEAALDRLVGRRDVISCASPTSIFSLPVATGEELSSEPCLRLAGYWHDSLIEGPGRRSVAKLQGCPIHCSGCAAEDSWDPLGGYLVSVSRLTDALLDPPTRGTASRSSAASRWLSQRELSPSFGHSECEGASTSSCTAATPTRGSSR
jgi:hypothetical protein